MRLLLGALVVVFASQPHPGSALEAFGRAKASGLIDRSDIGSDIDAYFAKLKPQLAHCAVPPQRRGPLGVCVYVSPGGAIVHGDDLGTSAGSGKQMLMDMMLRGVVEKLLWRGAGWLSFCMVYTASGPTVRSVKKVDKQTAVLAIGKREPDRQPGLLIPNPFFISPEWWDNMTVSWFAKARQVPWESRSSGVFFRGACGPGAHARVELLSIQNEQLDVGFTGVDGYGDVALCVRDILSRKRAADFKSKAIRGPKAIKAHAAGDRLAEKYVMKRGIKGHVPVSNFSQYKYLLHMPGSATGSYSRNLQYLFTHGAVVLIWRNPAVEWYYRFLVDGVHCVFVDANTLKAKVDLIERSPAMQLTLRRGARRFFLEHLAGAPLAARWRAILDVVAARQPASETPPPIDFSTACTCDEGLLSDPPDWAQELNPCAKCEITHKKGNSVARFIGILPRRSAA
ncbi:hypothetical protein M885DRAFT_626917 [Pelagophyceae sp. CCMP2097]|nr:hypothetical protein M885DRAFT_626917 [Pelagophyceae sp. CCMP2097]